MKIYSMFYCVVATFLFGCSTNTPTLHYHIEKGPTKIYPQGTKSIFVKYSIKNEDGSFLYQPRKLILTEGEKTESQFTTTKYILKDTEIFQDGIRLEFTGTIEQKNIRIKGKVYLDKLSNSNNQSSYSFYSSQSMELNFDIVLEPQSRSHAIPFVMGDEKKKFIIKTHMLKNLKDFKKVILQNSSDSKPTQFINYNDLLKDPNVITMSVKQKIFGVSLGLNTKEGFKVVQVSKNSPAGKLGIKVGSILLKIDDQPISKMTMKEVIELLKTKNSCAMTFKLKDGKTEVVQIKKGSYTLKDSFGETKFIKPKSLPKTKQEEKKLTNERN